MEGGTWGPQQAGQKCPPSSRMHLQYLLTNLHPHFARRGSTPLAPSPFPFLPSTTHPPTQTHLMHFTLLQLRDLRGVQQPVRPRPHVRVVQRDELQASGGSRGAMSRGEGGGKATKRASCSTTSCEEGGRDKGREWGGHGGRGSAGSEGV